MTTIKIALLGFGTVANSSISFETKDLQGSLEDLLLDIRSMKGIIKVEILGQA